jgi:hypothetical protein
MNVKALKLEGRKHEVIDIENTLEALQNAVGGYIETVRIRVDDAVMIVNEEGLLLGRPYNAAASGLAGQPIVGTALVVGTDGEEFTDIPNVIA